MWCCCSLLVVELPREWTKTAHRQNGPDQGPKRPVSTKTAQTKTAHSIYKNGPNWCLKRPAKTALESNTFQQIIRTKIAIIAIVSVHRLSNRLPGTSLWYDTLITSVPRSSSSTVQRWAAGPTWPRGWCVVSSVDRNSGGKRVVDAT